MAENDIEHLIALTAEHATVDKKQVAGDQVRVATVTRTRDHAVDEEIVREEIEVSHVPIGREVEVAPEITRDGDLTVIPVMEEILVWQRRLILKEEIHVRRVKVTGRHQETVTLRKQEAVITRTRGADGKAADQDQQFEPQGDEV